MAKEGRAESRSELRGRGGSPVNSADPASRQDQGRAAHATSNSQGQLKFFPPRYAKTFQSWHENIRDWCISRQLWWGHRIPVWTYKFTGYQATLTNGATLEMKWNERDQHAIDLSDELGS